MDQSLKRLVPGLRPGEERVVFPLFWLFFLITFSFYIIKPVKESFLISVTPGWWPYADLLTALLIGFVVALNTRLMGKARLRTYISAIMAFFISNLAVFWMLFTVRRQGLAVSPVLDASGIYGGVLFAFGAGRAWPVTVFGFSFWSDVFIALSVTSFWIIVNDIFNPHEAKRLIGPLVSGGLFGGIGGALLTSRLALSTEPEELLLVSASCLVIGIFLVNKIYREKKKLGLGDASAFPQAHARGGYAEGLRSIRKDRYLRLLTSVVMVSMIIAVLINYQFKTVIKETYETGMERTAFLGTFFFAVLVVSTIFHLLATERVIKVFGLQAAMLLAPVFLAAGSAAAFAIPAGAVLAWSCGMRGTEKLFDNTTGQSVRELLYMPVAPEIKYRAKMTIDMFVNKFGTGLGAVLYLAIYNLSGFGYKTVTARIRELGTVTFVFCLAWIVLSVALYREYPRLLKKSLHRKWTGGREVLAEKSDATSAGMLIDLVDSREKSTALYAMNLFDLMKTRGISPELRELLHGKEDEIRARSLDGLLDVGGEVFYRDVDETLVDMEMKSEIEEVFHLDVYKSVMAKSASRMTGSGSEVERMEAAKLLGLMEAGAFVTESLAVLLRDASPDVVHYALGSAAVHLRPEHVPIIMELLADRSACRDAVQTLAAYGPGIEDILGPRMSDPAEKPGIRRAIPDVLAQVGTQKAADILVGCLGGKDLEVEKETIEAILRIRMTRPLIEIDRETVRRDIVSSILICYRSAMKEEGAPGRFRPDEAGMKSVFDLLAMVYPVDDMIKAYQNLAQGSRRSIDYSLELLDNLLDRELRGLLFPLLEDIPEEERVRLMERNMRAFGGRQGIDR